MSHPQYPSTEYFKRRHQIGQALVGIEMCAGYPEYRLAMALLCGEQDRCYPIERSFWQRLKDSWNAGVSEFRTTRRIVGASPV